MGNPHFALIISTVALASALPRAPEGTPRHQQVSEYFPDPRYPDQMVNPAFMTAKCMSEGVFQHPYKCTWYYRCHDRIGRGFFHTAYFICEAGTEFDDDLDQCIPKSGTCGDENDISFCRTLTSSCRSCTVGTSQQELCEFKECYSGGRDSGIQRICEQGQLHNGETCVEVSNCPNVAVGNPRGECPLNKLRPTAKWTDQASGCTEYTGCRAGRHYQETLCSSYYDCPEGIKVLRSCPDGYLFSSQWALCIQPPIQQDNCSTIAPPPPPRPCSPSQGLGDTCQDHTGCLAGETTETTQSLCEYYTCGPTNPQKFRCPGSDLFNPNTKTCHKKPSICVKECYPENAVIWESCNFETGCRLPSIARLSELLCQEYSCTENRNSLRPCGPGKVFDPTPKRCITELTPCPIEPSCTASDARLWGECDTVSGVSGCRLGGPEVVVEECQHFQCSANGGKFYCQNGQVFSPTTLACVDPLSACVECTEDRAAYWGDCIDVFGCQNDFGVETTVQECGYYTCSLTGSEFRCEVGQVFNPDRKACVSPLSPCLCTAERASKWENCVDVTGCTVDSPFEITEKQCQNYMCSDTGTAFQCEVGKVFSPDRRTCVKLLSAANCPCTVDRALFWGGCIDVNGCTADDQNERTVQECGYYTCSLTGSEFRCEVGQVFNPDRKACVSPLSPCPCTADRALFWGGCIEVNGCTADDQNERTVNQCQHYSCSENGAPFYCEGGQVFNPNSKACIDPLEVCPECTPDQALGWDRCTTFCQDDGSKDPQLCVYYTCTTSLNDKQACKGAQTRELFNPELKTCIPMPSRHCARAFSSTRETCTANKAAWWYNCSTTNACVADRYPQQKQNLCEKYSCEENGPEFLCNNGQKYDSDQAACITPLTGLQC